MNKQDIIFNIPESIKQLYNIYITPIQRNLQYDNIIFYDIQYYHDLLNQFFNNQEYINFKLNINYRLYNFKRQLKNLSGNLYCDDHIIDIDNIQSIWMPSTLIYKYLSSNITQYFLYVNNIYIDSTRFYFSGKKHDTILINNLGFLNQFQYNILYKLKDDIPFLNKLKIYYTHNPSILTHDSLKELLLYVIENNPDIDINIIKKYWLLPVMSKQDIYDINNIKAKYLLTELNK